MPIRVRGVVLCGVVWCGVGVGVGVWVWACGCGCGRGCVGAGVGVWVWLWIYIYIYIYERADLFITPQRVIYKKHHCGTVPDESTGGVHKS